MKLPIQQMLFAAYCSTITAVVMLACSPSTKHTLPPLSPKAADCVYHVVERYLDDNEALVKRVLDLPRGEPQVEELVQVLLEIGKDSPDIVKAGDEMWQCLPKKVVAPPPDAGNKVM